MPGFWRRGWKLALKLDGARIDFVLQARGQRSFADKLFFESWWQVAFVFRVPTANVFLMMLVIVIVAVIIVAMVIVMPLPVAIALSKYGVANGKDETKEAEEEYFDNFMVSPEEVDIQAR